MSNKTIDAEQLHEAYSVVKKGNWDSMFINDSGEVIMRKEWTNEEDLPIVQILGPITLSYNIRAGHAAIYLNHRPESIWSGYVKFDHTLPHLLWDFVVVSIQSTLMEALNDDSSNS